MSLFNTRNALHKLPYAVIRKVRRLLITAGGRWSRQCEWSAASPASTFRVLLTADPSDLDAAGRVAILASLSFVKGKQSVLFDEQDSERVPVLARRSVSSARTTH